MFAPSFRTIRKAIAFPHFSDQAIDRGRIMYGKLTNRYNRRVRVYIYRQSGSGMYVIEPNHWVPSGYWTPYDKYMVVYDYDTWALYGCRIIRPNDGCWYDVVPSAPNQPNPMIDMGSPQFPNPPGGTGGTGGSGGSGSGSSGQNPNP